MQAKDTLAEDEVAEQTPEADAGASTIHLDERSLFLGQERGRGSAMVCPDLESWVATELQARSAVQKERRKAREERALAREAATLTAPPTGEGTGNSGGGRGGKKGPRGGTK